MSLLSGILEVRNTNGERVDPPATDGTQPPVRLVLGDGIEGTATANGGFTDVRLDATGETTSIALADHTAFRALSPSSLVDGEVITFSSPPGTYVYSTTSGAGMADDDRTVLKLTAVLSGSNGRAYNVNESPVLPTIAALRLAVSGKQAAIQVQNYATVADNAGGIFDYDASDTTSSDNGGTIIVAGSHRYKLRHYGAINVRQFGARGDVVHKTGCAITSGNNFFTATGFTSADIGKSIVFPKCGAADGNGHVVPMAGTITNVAGTTVTVSFTAVTSASGQTVSYGTNDTAAFQAAYDACANGQLLFVPRPTGAAYGITAQWGGTKAIRIKGDARGSTLLEWLSGPGAATNMISLTGGGIYDSSVEDLQFTGPAYTTLDYVHVQDCTYFLARQLTFSTQPYATDAGVGTIASNQTNALHFKNVLSGEVPPRGNIRICDVLVTNETATQNADNSHCIWLEGNATTGFQQVSIEGEINLEQSEYGIRADYVTGLSIKCVGLIQGNRINIAIFNSNHAKVDDEVECANEKRSVTRTALLALYIDGATGSEYVAGPGCTNTRIYDPLLNPARIEVADPSYLWWGTGEGAGSNISSPTFRNGTTFYDVNTQPTFGGGGFVAAEVVLNTASDGFYFKRYSFNHSASQADRAFYLVDFAGNVQYHVGTTATPAQFRWFGGLDNNVPFGCFDSAGLRVDGKTANIGVAPGARLHVVCKTAGEIGAIVQAMTSQTASIQEWQSIGGGAVASVNKDGCVGATGGDTTTAGFFFQADPNTGMYRIGADNAALIAAGTKMVEWTATLIALYGGNPVAQASRAGQITDSTGSSATGAVVAVSGTGDDTTINDNLHRILVKLNAIEAMLSAAGGGIGVSA